jgi:Uma2 family endonuclease
MNDQFPEAPRTPTQAAEGLPRWRWSLAEFDRFIELGYITEDDKVELIGGEIVPMAARGIAHETVKTDIKDWLIERVPRHLRVEPELAWRPAPDTYCEPDIAVFPRSVRPVSTVPPTQILLLIEIADTTEKKDRTTKSALYARLGVREYWVVDVHTRVTYVFLDPQVSGYRRTTRVRADRPLRPTAMPELKLKLRELPFCRE